MANQELLKDLSRAKAIFQTRAIMAAMDVPNKCPVCGQAWPNHNWNCALNRSSK